MKYLIYPILVTVLVLSFSCNWEGDPAADSGTISISIQDNVTRTLGADLATGSYQVSGSGPDGEVITDISSDTDMVLRNVTVGNWTITISALNTQGETIGTAVQSSTVSVNAVTTLNFTIAETSGTGTLSIDLDWPETAIASPVIIASLTPDGGSATSLAFSITDNTAAFSGDYTNGFYILQIQVYNGTTLLWGITEGVRMAAGQTVEGVYSLTAAQTNSIGGLALTVNNNIDQNFNVSISGGSDILLLGEDFTLAANSVPVGDSFQWYHNGELLTGESSSSLTIGSALPVGSNTVSVVVRSGTSLSSKSLKFLVSSSTEGRFNDICWYSAGNSVSNGGVSTFSPSAAFLTEYPGTVEISSSQTEAPTGYDVLVLPDNGTLFDVTDFEGTFIVTVDSAVSGFMEDLYGDDKYNVYWEYGTGSTLTWVTPSLASESCASGNAQIITSTLTADTTISKVNGVVSAYSSSVDKDCVALYLVTSAAHTWFWLHISGFSSSDRVSEVIDLVFKNV